MSFSRCHKSLDRVYPHHLSTIKNCVCRHCNRTINHCVYRHYQGTTLYVATIRKPLCRSPLSQYHLGHLVTVCCYSWCLPCSSDPCRFLLILPQSPQSVSAVAAVIHPTCACSDCHRVTRNVFLLCNNEEEKEEEQLIKLLKWILHFFKTQLYLKFDCRQVRLIKAIVFIYQYEMIFPPCVNCMMYRCCTFCAILCFAGLRTLLITKCYILVRF